MTKSDRVPLSTLPCEIRNLRRDKKRPSYRKSYNAAVNAVIPAERGDNGRWTVARADVPLIAEMLCGPERDAVAA